MIGSREDGAVKAHWVRGRIAIHKSNRSETIGKTDGKIGPASLSQVACGQNPVRREREAAKGHHSRAVKRATRKCLPPDLVVGFARSWRKERQGGRVSVRV